MALVFSNPGFVGAAVGRLTSLQADGNIQDLWDAIQAKADQGVGIASVALVGGNQLQFQLTDLSFLPPVTLPTASFRFQGQWLPDTDYLVDDVVTDLGATYLVLIAHTSAGTFDPGANDGMGNDWYGLMLDTPTVFPAGGLVGQRLEKASLTDYDTAWAWDTLAGLHDVLQSPAPTTGELVYWSGAAFGYLPQSSLTITAGQLPLPTASTLGGVKSLAAVASNFLTQIGTDGSVLAAQPAFTDISGSVAASQLPTPTASTLGGVESKAAASHNFLTQIGTDGSVTAAQPAFTDISGTISAVQSRPTTATTLGASGTVSLDPTLGDVFKITPTNNVTLNAASAPVAAKITLVVTTSGTSSFNITPTTNFKSTGALATGSVSAKVFTIHFVGDGTNLNEIARTVAM